MTSALERRTNVSTLISTTINYFFPEGVPANSIGDMLRQRVNAIGVRYETRRFGGAIEGLIEASGFSLRWLAGKIGRDPSTVHGWKMGRTLPDTDRDIDLLGKFLGVRSAVLRQLKEIDEMELTLRKSPATDDYVEQTLRLMSQESIKDLATMTHPNKKPVEGIIRILRGEK